MKDLRCMVGRHDYAEPPATGISDVPGLKLECTRCRKARVLRVGPPTTPRDEYIRFGSHDMREREEFRSTGFPPGGVNP